MKSWQVLTMCVGAMGVGIVIRMREDDRGWSDVGSGGGGEGL